MKNVILLVREVAKMVLTIIALVGPAYMYAQTQNGWMFFLYILSLLFLTTEHAHYEDINKQEGTIDLLKGHLKEHPEHLNEILNLLGDEQKTK